MRPTTTRVAAPLPTLDPHRATREPLQREMPKSDGFAWDASGRLSLPSRMTLHSPSPSTTKVVTTCARCRRVRAFAAYGRGWPSGLHAMINSVRPHAHCVTSLVEIVHSATTLVDGVAPIGPTLVEMQNRLCAIQSGSSGGYQTVSL